MSLRTNYAFKTNTNQISATDAKKAIAKILGQIGGSIVYFAKAKAFIV